MLVSDYQIQFAEHIGANSFEIWSVFDKKNTIFATSPLKNELWPKTS